ncbi:hypothetical protein HMPREF2955_11420 [Prevotella sp. HMSC073D09]|nr:hypothetical protein HMPREF2955_11420 [Prevotella sp. HMSC073D09]
MRLYLHGGCCKLPFKRETSYVQGATAFCALPLVMCPWWHRGRTNFTNTWPKHVLVHVSFAPFVRILVRACQVLNGLCVFKICAKDWFYLQNSHFLVNFAAGYEVRSRTLPHRFCEINSFY